MSKLNLFKYYTYNANNINAVLEGKFWFAHPSQFNDPFDAQVSLSSSADEIFLDNIAEYVEKQVGSEYADIGFIRLNLGELKDGVDEYYNNPDDYKAPPFSKSFYGAIDYFELDSNDLINFLIGRHKEPEIKTFLATQASLGVTCFAGKGCDPNMWAHYAANHQGFCVHYELDVSTLKNDVVVSPVVYKDEPLTVEAVDGALEKDVICQQLSRKSTKWSTEGETRVISLTGGNKLIKIPADIVGICFGNKMPKSEISVMERLFFKQLKEDKIFSAKLNRAKQRMHWSCRGSGFVEDYSD